MLRVDYGIDLSQIEYVQDESLLIVEILHQDFDSHKWTTTSLHESEVLNFQNELDSLGLDYLPVV